MLIKNQDIRNIKMTTWYKWTEHDLNHLMINDNELNSQKILDWKTVPFGKDVWWGDAGKKTEWMPSQLYKREREREEGEDRLGKGESGWKQPANFFFLVGETTEQNFSLDW